MWARFALPFVRLDSAGIQRVRPKLPATRNPFTYYKRVIVSIDTLKSDRYVAGLQQQRWDAVVIAESHNLANSLTLNNRLARILARNSEALILASATPHNGRKDSFAELIRLLDQAAVPAGGDLPRDAVERLSSGGTGTAPRWRASSATTGPSGCRRTTSRSPHRPRRTRWPTSWPTGGCSPARADPRTAAPEAACSPGPWPRPARSARAVDRDRQSVTHLAHSSIAQPADSVDQDGQRDTLDRIEIDRRTSWHRVVPGLKHHLADEPANRRRARRDQCASVPRDHRIARENDDRTATDLGHLTPPHLAARGHCDHDAAAARRNEARSPQSSGSSSGCSS